MADIADRANDAMLETMDNLLAARQPAFVGQSLSECLDCGDEIPSARQLAAPGCTLCTFCQSITEKRGRANG
ncbi:TraR/DksA family transcriptional regulator [Pseudomonas nitroreducens]|uniref:TraR/DksA C4-type zinc finger protein n=1 Tax=Pseudomonas nitroreducens TaxID=46680 RepID=UPI00147321AD|nr:TraR/DksA C4-type zinc finger protein [Pseudomonas nitroreducens]NMZ72958.1 TraR/DksA family transcriptional regulator [Pseudomonas nitroreducens]